MKIYLFIPLLLIMSCSRGSNPYQFEKIEKPAPEMQTRTVEKKYTLLELYLNERVTADYFIKWFFQDQEGYRSRLFFIKDEIEMKMPLSVHDERMIIILEYRMNRIIQSFNRKNFFRRATDFVVAAYESRQQKNDKANSNEDEDNLAKIISDNPNGFMNSFFKYGFKIEEVDFLSDNNTNE